MLRRAKAGVPSTSEVDVAGVEIRGASTVILSEAPFLCRVEGTRMAQPSAIAAPRLAKGQLLMAGLSHVHVFCDPLLLTGTRPNSKCRRELVHRTVLSHFNFGNPGNLRHALWD